MSSVYLIGSKAGPCYIGEGSRPEHRLADAIVTFPETTFRVAGQWPLREPTAIALVIRIVRAWFKDDSEWIRRPEKDVSAAIDEAYALVTGELPTPPGFGEFGRALQQVREQDFRLSQPVMAKLMGVSTASYSRWEAGHRVPDIQQLDRLYIFAKAAEMKFPSRRIFDLAHGEINPAS